MNSRCCGVLFDMDGVLVQTEPLKAQAHAVATREWGAEVAPELYATVMGQPLAVIRTTFLAAGRVQGDPARYAATFRRVYRRLLQSHLAPNPGVVALLPHLRQRGYRLGVVTSDYAGIRDENLGRLGLAPYFDVLVGQEDVAHIKPAPDGYRLALDRLDLPPGRVVAVEDSAAGLQAATGAGLRVMAVRHPFNLTHDFSQAAHIFDPLRQTPTSMVQTLVAMLET